MERKPINIENYIYNCCTFIEHNTSDVRDSIVLEGVKHCMNTVTSREAILAVSKRKKTEQPILLSYTVLYIKASLSGSGVVKVTALLLGKEQRTKGQKNAPKRI